VGRQPRPLDPTAGPVQSFAADLRTLRERAGSPKYLQMARQTGKSRTALAEAAGGDHLPTWETVAAFVTACRGDPDTWRVKWEQVRDDLGRTTVNTVADDVPATADTTTANPPDPDRFDDPQTEPDGWLHQALPFVATAFAAATIAAATTVLIMAHATSNSTGRSVAGGQAQAVIVVTVQNKVAPGPSQLIEDSTPAYLSTKAMPYCANNGCKVPGTEVSSGARLVAVCYINGAEMVNYNLDSSESKQNPHRADSTLWYRAVFPDGRSGYISEIYIMPADRGGKGLPICT